MLELLILVSSKSPKPQKPREKKMRVWDMSGTSAKNLDYSERHGDGAANDGDQEAQSDPVGPPKDVWRKRRRGPGPLSLDVLGVLQGMQLSSMKGDLLSVDYESSEEEEMEEERVVVSETSKPK